MEAEVALSELPKACDWGFKKDTNGNDYWWRGYKAHIVWADGMIPLFCVTTSASVHDSQTAIPMMKTLATHVSNLYDLLDGAYNAFSIRQVSKSLGHVPLISPSTGNGEKVGMVPSECVRYRERSNAERGNSRLKDSFGLRDVRVKGQEKVHFHTMLGILVLFADQILKPVKFKKGDS
jgi:Transposase DDE domain